MMRLPWGPDPGNCLRRKKPTPPSGGLALPPREERRIATILCHLGLRRPIRDGAAASTSPQCAPIRSAPPSGGSSPARLARPPRVGGGPAGCAEQSIRPWRAVRGRRECRCPRSIAPRAAAVSPRLGPPELSGLPPPGPHLGPFAASPTVSRLRIHPPNRFLMPITGDRHARHQLLRIGFECPFRAAKIPAWGLE